MSLVQTKRVPRLLMQDEVVGASLLGDLLARLCESVGHYKCCERSRREGLLCGVVC